MMKVLLETAKVVGTATEKTWSQVHLFSPADEKKQKRRGELLAVLSLGGLEEGVEAVAAGREIIARLHEEYYGNLEGKALEQLETAVKKVFFEAAAESESDQSLARGDSVGDQRRLGRRPESVKTTRSFGPESVKTTRSFGPESVETTRSFGPEIEIGAAAVVGNVLYLAIAGKGQAILQRNSKMGVILQGLTKADSVEDQSLAKADSVEDQSLAKADSVEDQSLAKADSVEDQRGGEVVTASGHLKDGDLFCLGTKGFFQALATGVLKAALATGSPTEATEALAPIIHGRPESGNVAAVVCKVKEEKREEEVIVAPPVEEKRVVLKPIGQPLAELKEKVNQRMSQLFSRLQNQLGEKAIYLKREVKEKGEKPESDRWRLGRRPERSKKTVFTVVLVLLLLLGISVALGARQKRHLGVERKTSLLFNQAKQKKDEGLALLELNPIRARELLLEARNLSQQIEAEGLKTTEFEKFKAELEQALNKVLKEYQVEAGVFFDLELIKQEAKGDDLAVSGGKIMILDIEKTSVYEVGIADQKQAIVAGGKGLEAASYVAAFLPKIFILTEKGIFEVDKLTKKERLAIEVDEEWGEIVDLSAFAGNLYLLDKKGEIWQYPAIETGFGARRRWLKGEVTPDFSNAEAMAIDGSIWILKADGTIWKYTRGAKDAFGIAGLDKPFGSPTAFYTDDDQENLYILDKGNLRVVVLAKSGEYEASYYWEGIRDVTGLVVSEEERKILLLSGSKIYEIEKK